MLLAVTSFEATISVFDIKDENNSFSNTTPGFWTSRRSGATINKLRDLLAFRSQNDIELHVEEVRKRGNQLKTADQEYKIFDLDTRKNETIELKNIEKNNLEDMVFRMDLT